MGHTSPSSDPALSDCLEAQPEISAAIGQHVTAESENKNKISFDLGSLVSLLSLCLNILFGYGLTLSGNHHDGPGEPGPFPQFLGQVQDILGDELSFLFRMR